MRFLQNNNIISLAGQSFIAFLFLFINILLAHSLSRDSFGQWSLFLTGATFFDVLYYSTLGSGLTHYFHVANDSVRREDLIGAGWASGLIGALFLGGVMILLSVVLAGPLQGSGYDLLFRWYPVVLLISLPFRHALMQFLAGQEFGKINIFSAIQAGSFLILLSVFLFIGLLSAETVVLALGISFGLGSFLSLVCGFSGISLLKKSTSEAAGKLLHYGKFTAGTTISANLLKSADILIIGFIRNPADVALYAIPIRLLQIIEIPLTSLAVVAFPRISKAHHHGDRKAVIRLFLLYGGILTLCAIPIIVLCFVFARELIWIIGGSQYFSNAEVLSIFSVFLTYGLFVSFERFTGTTLDSIGKPRDNFIKVLAMAGINILGDILALALFDSLTAVAIVTVVNVVFGVLAGFYLLRKHTGLGWSHFRALFRKVEASSLDEISVPKVTTDRGRRNVL